MGRGAAAAAGRGGMRAAEQAPLELLIPDLPCADALLPWLRRIDAARQYTNFGPLVHELEQRLAAEWPVPPEVPAPADLQVLTASSGTAALELALAALDLPAGSEVLMPAFTFAATAAAVLRCGLRPVFADVEASTWQLGIETAWRAAQRRPLRLVLPVATFGCPLDVAAWDDFARRSGLPVLMDAAAAFGNQAVGQRAHVAFSLHATKPFGIGEGGMLATRDAAFAARVRQLSNFGFSQGRATAVAGNAKMSEYAAAVALCQWARFGQRQAHRRTLWQAYRQRLQRNLGLALQAGFENGALPANLVLQLPGDAAPVAATLARQGIASRRWYCPPLTAQPAFAVPGLCAVFSAEPEGALPQTRLLSSRSLGLPWHSFMTVADQDRVLAALGAALPGAHRQPAVDEVMVDE